MQGHIGVYVGDGKCVESTPKWTNNVQFSNLGNIPQYKTGNYRIWAKHGKLPYVKYEKVEDNKTIIQPPIAPVNGVKGIDVSKWQGEIDWNKVKADGIKFAMIRLGYGSADGKSCGIDGYFEKNVTNAIKAGVDIGCYFYSYATSVEAAKREAEFVVGVLSKYKGTFTYPISFDLEDKTQAVLGKTTLTNMVTAFGDVIEKAGYWCSLYSNLNWLKNYLDDSKLQRFDHWVAQWAPACTYSNKSVTGMWQNSSTGKVNGINGNVDTDIAYKDYPTVIRTQKLNGFTSASQKPTAPAVTLPPVAPKPSTPASPITIGSLVKITGSTYYSGTAIPSWVKTKNWYVKDISGDRAVIDKSEDGKSAICSPIKVSDIALVSTGGTTPAPKPWVPAVGDIVNYDSNVHYSSANSANGIPCKGGKAKITQIYQLGKSKHPYHLIRVSGSGSTVYGWVDANTFAKA